MGGDIQVESHLGKGSTFSFTIPVEIGKKIISIENRDSPKVLALVPNQPTSKILVVDDRSVNRQLLVKLLSPLGFALQEASNGEEAIAIWQEWQPDLIWMDLKMPIMDGYTATKYINSQVQGDTKTIIVALTAHVLEEEKAVVMAAGFDDFLRKPFTENMIFDILTKHLGVQYIYEESILENDLEKENLLISTDLAIMSEKWRSQLYIATIEGDINLIMELIQEIPATKTSLVKNFTKLASEFELQQIIDLIEPLRN